MWWNSPSARFSFNMAQCGRCWDATGLAGWRHGWGRSMPKPLNQFPDCMQTFEEVKSKQCWLVHLSSGSSLGNMSLPGKADRPTIKVEKVGKLTHARFFFPVLCQSRGPAHRMQIRRIKSFLGLETVRVYVDSSGRKRCVRDPGSFRDSVFWALKLCHMLARIWKHHPSIWIQFSMLYNWNGAELGLNLKRVSHTYIYIYKQLFVLLYHPSKYQFGIYIYIYSTPAVSRQPDHLQKLANSNCKSKSYPVSSPGIGPIPAKESNVQTWPSTRYVRCWGSISHPFS